MGFEVLYHFHREKSKGEYDKSVTESASIKVGSPYEEIPLEVLAGKIMALMARRNILVVGIEAFEVVKKSLTFKEMEDGIVIKNRKFRFDDGPAMVAGEAVAEKPEDQLAALLAANPQLANLLKPQTQHHPHEAIQKPQTGLAKAKPVAGGKSGQKAMRYEIYMPEDLIWIENSRKLSPDMAFTKNKRYPIFSEKPNPAGTMAGMLYNVLDDNGKTQVVSDKLFIPVTNVAVEGSVEKGLSDAGLSWGGVVNDEAVPDIRRR